MREKEVEPSLEQAWNNREEVPNRNLLDLTRQLKKSITNEDARVNMVKNDL
jgi:hypothetical protein